jgi:putative FmdB family regulatory protein
MPIYEYKCRKCQKQFEVFQGISDDDFKQCKFCKGPVDKLISLSSFHLKGSGWYVTDYGGKKPSASERKEEKISTSSDEEKSKTSSSADNNDK